MDISWLAKRSMLRSRRSACGTEPRLSRIRSEFRMNLAVTELVDGDRQARLISPRGVDATGHRVGRRLDVGEDDVRDQFAVVAVVHDSAGRHAFEDRMPLAPLVRMVQPAGDTADTAPGLQRQPAGRIVAARVSICGQEDDGRAARIRCASRETPLRGPPWAGRNRESPRV